MVVAFIYARSRDYCIGSGSALPWQLPDEYAFLERTMFGYAVIMGRKTQEDQESALRGRFNIVLRVG